MLENRTRYNYEEFKEKLREQLGEYTFYKVPKEYSVFASCRTHYEVEFPLKEKVLVKENITTAGKVKRSLQFEKGYRTIATVDSFYYYFDSEYANALSSKWYKITYDRMLEKLRSFESDFDVENKFAYYSESFPEAMI